MLEELKTRIEEYFSGLSFVEETHKYSLNGKEFKTSVSGVVEHFIDHVDYRVLSLRKDHKLGLPMTTSMTLWDLNADVAKAIGTYAHFFGEHYPFHRNMVPEDGYQHAIVKFWSQLPDHIVPVFTELKMYHRVYHFPGMKDITLFNTKTGKFIIADYKTNKDLWKRFQFTNLLAPFEYLPDTPFSHYEIQLSLYQILFEQVPGVEVEKRTVVHIKPDGEYAMYRTRDLTKPLKKWLQSNSVC